MELRHLRHFVAVAEELHFARAAERLGMEQSPLSHSIRNLETELGVSLLHRTTRRTWLTRAGARFYAEAVRILEAADAAKAGVRHEDYDRPTRLALGLAEHAAGEPFTRFLFELEHRAPSIVVDLSEIASAEAARLVVDRVLDLAIVLQPIDAPGLRRSRGWAEPLSLVVPLGHPLAERARVSLSEVVLERFVLPPPAASPGYAAQIETLFARHDLRPAARTLLKHQNTMVSFVATGRGVSLLPDSIAHGLTTVAVLPLDEEDAEVVSWLLYREEDSSDGVSFALEVATVVGAGGALPSDLDAEPVTSRARRNARSRSIDVASMWGTSAGPSTGSPYAAP
jgi:DNA-binding transcriptional LysR family regulator